MAAKAKEETEEAKAVAPAEEIEAEQVVEPKADPTLPPRGAHVSVHEGDRIFTGTVDVVNEDRTLDVTIDMVGRFVQLYGVHQRAEQGGTGWDWSG